MTEDNENIFGEPITKEESDIIEFISERELVHEAKTREVINAEVLEKFGERGLEVLKQLTEDVDSKDFECAECAKNADEVSKDIQSKLQAVEMFLDTNVDPIANEVISDETSQGRDLCDTDIIRAIKNDPRYKEGDIPEGLVDKVKVKVLFLGITEGWLVDEYFNKC